MINNNLIIDVGMHKGEDTSFFLFKGYNVVAIDATPALIEMAKDNFSKYISNGQLTLLNYAVSDKENEKIKFYISENSLWNSINPDISNRKNLLKATIEVETIKLSTIINKYGVPHYCKIDIEGYDEIALKTLSDLNSPPEYISVETECLGENDTLTEEQSLITLNRLKNLGYKYFKLVDQYSLKVLEPSVKFFKEQKTNILKKALNKFGLRKKTNREKLSSKFGYNFPFGASGPFGADLEGQWLKFEEAKNTLLKHRSDYFSLKSSLNYDFWCDWHAKLD
jgi:FkbM family methyltransferase